jgi:hypothetical protein
MAALNQSRHPLYRVIFRCPLGQTAKERLSAGSAFDRCQIDGGMFSASIDLEIEFVFLAFVQR